MKILLAIATLGIVIVWDFTQNRGEMTETVVRSVIGFARSLGF